MSCQGTSDSFDDRISYSPSLSSIFSFLDIEDIIHCQLVSKRWNQIMIRESDKLRKIHLEFCFLDTWRGDTLIITLRNRSKSEIFVTRDQIRISEHQLPYLYRLVQETDLNELTRGAVIKAPSKRREWEEERSGETRVELKWREFAIDSFKNGLRTLLTILLSNYRLKSMRFEIGTGFSQIDEVTSYIVDILRELGIKCDTICHDPLLPQTDTLYDTLDCSHIEVTEWSQVQPLMEANKYFVKGPVFSIEEKMEMFDILQGWREGAYRIKYLVLFNEHYKTAFEWPMEYFYRKLSELDHISVTKDEEKKEMEIVLTRVMDDVVLRFYLSNVRGIIEIHDAKNTGEPIRTPNNVNGSFKLNQY